MISPNLVFLVSTVITLISRGRKMFSWRDLLVAVFIVTPSYSMLVLVASVVKALDILRGKDKESGANGTLSVLQRFVFG